MAMKFNMLDISGEFILGGIEKEEVEGVGHYCYACVEGVKKTRTESCPDRMDPL